MSSNLACIGLGVADAEALGELLRAVIPAGSVGRAEDGSALYVWTDESGARLTVSTDRSGAVVDVAPSYAGEPGADLAGLVARHDSVVEADVVVDGVVMGRLVVEVLAPGPVPAAGRASVTAFGLDVVVEDPAADGTTDQQGVEILRSIGLEQRDGEDESDGDDPDEPVALIGGVVLATRTATVGATGQAFHVSRLRTQGMEVDLCLAAERHPAPPGVGAVVTGTVYLVADLERPRVGRRWFRR